MLINRLQPRVSAGITSPAAGMLASMIALLAVAVALRSGHAESMLCSQAGPGWVTREAEGVGASLVEAKADAIRVALRQAVGEVVRSEIVVDGDAVDEFLIAFSTPEQVRSEQVGSPSLRPDGMIAVTMRVAIKAQSLARAFELHATRSGGRVTRTVTASAPSLQAARLAAIADGLRAIVGEFVDARVAMDDEKVAEVIRSFSTGTSVQSEQVGEATLTPAGEIEVTMRISLRPQELIDMFAAQAQGDILLDAENLAAEIAVARSNIQAQRALMQRLFTDLPIRLLVARLIDRDGRPIVDGRPDHRDVRPVDNDNVAIAFNIEIYFDLPSYYGKVLPNLVTALRAVSSEEQRAELSLLPSTDAGRFLFGGHDPRNPPKLRLWGSGSAVYKWPYEVFFTASRDAPIQPQERVVALSIGRNRDGSSEQWGLWRCPEWIAETIHTAASSVLVTNLALFLLDDERRVVAHSIHPLAWLGPLLVAGPDHSDGGIRLSARTLVRDETAGSYRLEWGGGAAYPLTFFEMNGVRPAEKVRPWFMNKWGAEAPWSGRMTFCSPRFCATWFGGSEEIVDILPVRVALILPQSEFERVRSITFDFFTDDHLAPLAASVPATDPGTPERRGPRR